MIDLINNNNVFDIVLGLIGGLGLFLYGINLMGDSLQALAGSKMKRIIEKLTNNIYVGILVGFIVTTVIQSSSGTTVLSISLIRAGLMTMPQAVGIIMGANMGTTVTAFLFSFPAISDYSLLVIGIGAVFAFFLRNKKLKTIGQALIGFGLLFYGMDLMGNGLKGVINESNYIRNILASFGNKPWLGLMTGFIVTAIVQSSSATTGIVQSIVDTGELTLTGAIPILFGNNIGTTITAIIAAIGGSIAAKRASLFHVFFNIFGALLFMIFLSPFISIIEYLQDITGASNKLAIAYAHLLFNFISTFSLVWFINYFILLIKKIIRGEEDDDELIDEILSENLIKNSPVLALESAKKIIIHMSKTVKKMLAETYQYITEPNNKIYEEAMALETIINTLDRRIHDYLVKLTTSIPELLTKELSKYLDTIRDLERIGDHCENLLEVYEYITENKGTFSEAAWEDLNKMFTIIILMLDHCLIIISNNNKKLAREVVELEAKVDNLEKTARKYHTLRVNEGVCISEMGIMFIELLSNLERIGDHCCNIAEYTLDEKYYQISDDKIRI